MGTLIIVALMAAGIIIGLKYLSTPERAGALRVFGKIQQLGTVVLLGAMGLWLGGNEDFWAGIGEIGLSGLLFALAGAASSLLLVWIACKPVFGKNGRVNK